MQGSGLAGELAKVVVKDAVTQKSKGKKSFFEKSDKDKMKEFEEAGKVLKKAPKRIPGALEKIVGKGVDAVKVQEETVPAPKAKKRGQFVKGSPEAKEWGRMMAERRKAKRKVGGKDSLPPSSRQKIQGAGVKEDAEMYAKNPLLLGFDAGIGLARSTEKNPKSKQNRERKRRIDRNERKAIKEAGKYINPITLVGLS